MGAVGFAGSSQGMARTPGSFGKGGPWNMARWEAAQVLRPAVNGKVPVISNLPYFDWYIQLLAGCGLLNTLSYNLKASF